MKAKNSKAQKSDGNNQMMPAHTECVSQRAYEIWEAHGCPHGGDTEHWLQAERELRELTRTQTPAK